MRVAAFTPVLLLSACSADATETVVAFNASSHYAGGTVTLGTEAHTLDANGHAVWVVEPPIVDDFLVITLELDGVLDSFSYGVAALRRDGVLPEDAALDRLTASLRREVETGACLAYVSFASTGMRRHHGDLIGTDARRCGPFAR